ncbi:hypothetical protein KP509_23G002200 [Ceratopteris richardii]|uniref:Uncharacterized protein n=1 Tax=Ceratopteris richardii TaxID=49495 RepID=A0A8T2RZI4_CERRI|nr:hypothetical protein KP509_23G002200 [Ceratopteris richardii]
MSSDVEPAKKILLPYLQRADELQKHEPLVAYYCRLYAMERGLKIPVKERTKTTNAILVSLMNQLEKDKKTVQLSPDDNLHVEGFALSVFAKADKQDRAGRADLNTAKTFYAASIFIEVLHQFGPLQPDIEQKQKYAVWKAADIRKALKEGRKPVPGPPGGDDDLSLSPRTSTDSMGTYEMNNTQAQEEKHFTGGHGDANTSFDSKSKAMLNQGSFIQASETQPHGQYIDHTVSPQQQIDFAPSGTMQGGYAAAYLGIYHPPPVPDTSAMSSYFPGDPRLAMDQYNSQHHTDNFQEYSHLSPGGHEHQSIPSVYNGVQDAAYYQTQRPYPSTVSYPVTAPLASDYSSAIPKDSGIGRTTSAPAFNTKSNSYHPSPDKIAEAQKAAKFAVSALAFDDVATAVSYLKQSLELLTISPN